ncbi:PRC-barrel domain-containing protein [Microvirga sp. BT689]|uniref:PRC-barrel domain-containing protein n=1 Tax=Microvirga arvi TaxID=2778731 RepID=UPI00194EE994|nr:PRC-barrel domain-containing protein [Microvirga arvi]MBM6583737.1 PRC-barrel domain-containing protein [Microvirga arvi]
MNQTNLLNSLVRDDQISGADIFDPQGRRIGVLQRVYREADGGCLIHADVAVGGFFGFGTRCYVFPWENLAFDPVLHGYRVSRTEMDQIARIDKPYVSPKRLLHGRW